MTEPDPPRDLPELRQRLDEVDRTILAALADRRGLVAEVAARKTDTTSVLRDREREQQLLGALAERGKALGLEPYFVVRVFREILDHSLRLQHELLARRADPGRAGRPLIVGYQGGEGAFSYLAASRYVSVRGGATLRGFPSFREMLEAVRERELDYAILPIENTTAGSINESYDLLAEMDLHLVGEEIQEVELCLVGVGEVPIAELRRVYSHPVALAQCRGLLRELATHGCEALSYLDTALSVGKVKADGDPTQAAIASAEAARVHGLPVLRHAVQDQKGNFTRMVVVAREPERFDLRIPCKTSVVFSTRHARGALARSIAILAAHDLNLTKLESRPRPNAAWEYRFYLDFEGNLDDPRVRGALGEFAAETSDLRVLGSYPARTLDAAQPADLPPS